jgi:hypothetical protein
MHKLDLALSTGKVWVQMNPNQVGELAIRMPLFEPSGRSAGSTTITLTNGSKVNLLESFDVKQIEACEDLLAYLREGQVILVG